MLLIAVLFSLSMLIRLDIFKELNCEVSDSAAKEIAGYFCRHFNFSCVGDPAVKYFDSTGLKIAPPYYRKAVSYDNNGISINCDNSKVITYKEFHYIESATEVLIKSGFDQFKSMLAYSGIADCALIVSFEMTEGGDLKYVMNSYDEAGNLLNYGQFIINASTGQIYLYSVEMASWCKGKGLPDKYSSFISLIDAIEVAKASIKEYDLKNYAVSKVSLVDESHGLSDQAWHIILRDEKGEMSEHMQIVINSVTGAKM